MLDWIAALLKGKKIKVKIDSDQDGSPALEGLLDLGEVFEEILKLLGKN
jgi:hypothetical protein